MEEATQGYDDQVLHVKQQDWKRQAIVLEAIWRPGADGEIRQENRGDQQVINWKDSECAAHVKLLEADRAPALSLSDQEGDDQEAADREEEVYPEETEFRQPGPAPLPVYVLLDDSEAAQAADSVQGREKPGVKIGLVGISVFRWRRVEIGGRFVGAIWFENDVRFLNLHRWVISGLAAVKGCGLPRKGGTPSSIRLQVALTAACTQCEVWHSATKSRL